MCHVFPQWRPLVSSQVVSLLDSVADLSGNKPISFITYIVFEQHNLFELCPVNKNILANFLYFLDIGYHRNPYVRAWLNCNVWFVAPRANSDLLFAV